MDNDQFYETLTYKTHKALDVISEIFRSASYEFQKSVTFASISASLTKNVLNAAPYQEDAQSQEAYKAYEEKVHAILEHLDQQIRFLFTPLSSSGSFSAALDRISTQLYEVSSLEDGLALLVSALTYFFRVERQSHALKSAVCSMLARHARGNINRISSNLIQTTQWVKYETEEHHEQ